jgi:hypothetical protein
MNSFRFQHFDNYQRRSLAPIRYVAKAAHFVSLPAGFGLYEFCSKLEVGCFL